MRRTANLLAALTVCAAMAVAPAPRAAAAALPTPAHVVIVVEENRTHAAIIGSQSAPFINTLAANGALMTQSFAETHPSEPNYLALFAGNTFGLTANTCPVNGGATPNLGSELLAAGRTFTGFAEDLPTVGSTVCGSGKYARKHAPWVNFTNVPGSLSMPFSAFPPPGNPQNYASLPTVSFVIPNLDNDMHDGSITQGDNWLNRELSPYAAWAKANNSLLILTWDEDNSTARNQIPTVIYGAHVRSGAYSQQISHYNVLSTLEQMYGLAKTGYAAQAPVIADIWGD